jgi:hypothetical protein
MEDKKPNKEAEGRVPEETRFKYIGFDVYPTQPKRFWKSEEEKRKLLEEVKKKGLRTAVEERDHSLVRTSVFSGVDRMVLTVTSLLLTVSFFLPWFSIRGEYFSFKVLGVGFFSRLGTLFAYAPLSGSLFSVFVILVGLTILSSFGAGVFSLVAIHKKHIDFEKYLVSLKKRLKLNLIPLVMWVAVIVISSIGMSTPFADAFKVDGFGDGFTVVNFFLLSSFGIWLSLPSVMVNCVKISDL